MTGKKRIPDKPHKLSEAAVILNMNNQTLRRNYVTTGEFDPSKLNAIQKRPYGNYYVEADEIRRFRKYNAVRATQSDDLSSTNT